MDRFELIERISAQAKQIAELESKLEGAEISAAKFLDMVHQSDARNAALEAEVESLRTLRVTQERDELRRRLGAMQSVFREIDIDHQEEDAFDGGVRYALHMLRAVVL